MRWLRAILSVVQPQEVRPPAPLPRHTPPLCVIGDVHGRLDLLDQMLAQIVTQPEGAQAQTIFVGDMIDRGPDSAGVLHKLYGLHRAAPDRVICLMGNHERMMLDFLADPAACGPRWIAAGGGETLTSFGLSPWIRRQKPQGMNDLASALRAALTPDVVDWLTALPLFWHDGLLAVTHAGADPNTPIGTQSPNRLLWGTRTRATPVRADGIWVVQGHTPVDTPTAEAHRIVVDTGAWRSGRLSAAWIDSTGLSFVTASSANMPSNTAPDAKISGDI